MKKVLFILSQYDHHPGELSIPAMFLISKGIEVSFTTKSGKKPVVDQNLLTGKGLGLIKLFYQASNQSKKLFNKLSKKESFCFPKKFSEININEYDGIIIPGGPGSGMRDFLSSNNVISLILSAYKKNKVIGACSQAVLLLANTKINELNKSIIHNKNITSILASQELIFWGLTKKKENLDYRTFKKPIEDLILPCLDSHSFFHYGPAAFLKDSENHLDRGFTVIDENIVTARWEGDMHRFSYDYLKLLKS